MIAFLRPDTDLDSVVREAISAGRTVYVVDAGPDVRDSIAQFAEVLRFPEWFGQNLDALSDSLRDFHGPPGGVTLIWDRIRPLRRAHPTGYESLLAVLDDASEERPDLEVKVVQR